MNTIFKKELRGYFYTYTAYIIAAIFVVVCSLFLWFFDNERNVFNIGNASLSSFFFIVPWIFVLIIPAATMSTLAEESQTGTLDWLFTQPLTIKNIVLGKYLAVLVLILFCLIPTITYVYTIYNLSLPTGNVDFGALFCGYLGVLLVASTFAAIGVFASSLSQNQIVAFMVSVFICFFLFYGLESLCSYNLLGSFDYIVQKIGVFYNYNIFVKGVADTRSVIYFVALDIIFLGLTMLSLQSKKW